jgi:hypothetical protein
VVLGHSDAERGRHQGIDIFAHAPSDELGANGVGADEAVGAVLFGGANGNDDAFGAFEIALDLLPGAKVEQHIAFRRAPPRFSACSASPVIPRLLPAELTPLLR